MKGIDIYMEWDWLMSDEEAARWREKYEEWNKRFWKLMYAYVIGIADEDDFARFNEMYGNF